MELNDGIKPHNSHSNYFVLIHNSEKQYQVVHTTPDFTYTRS